MRSPSTALRRKVASWPCSEPVVAGSDGVDWLAVLLASDPVVVCGWAIVAAAVSNAVIAASGK